MSAHIRIDIRRAMIETLAAWPALQGIRKYMTREAAIADINQLPALVVMIDADDTTLQPDRPSNQSATAYTDQRQRRCKYFAHQLQARVVIITRGITAEYQSQNLTPTTERSPQNIFSSPVPVNALPATGWPDDVADLIAAEVEKAFYASNHFASHINATTGPGSRAIARLSLERTTFEVDSQSQVPQYAATMLWRADYMSEFGSPAIAF